MQKRCLEEEPSEMAQRHKGDKPSLAGVSRYHEIGEETIQKSYDVT